MVPWVVTFTKSHRGLGHFAITTHTTRIWATTQRLCDVACAAMIYDPESAHWGLSGFTDVTSKLDADHMNIRKTDLFTSSKRGFYEFAHVPIVDFACIDDDDLTTIGARARAKVKP
jgi:hypothetical protein